MKWGPVHRFDPATNHENLEPDRFREKRSGSSRDASPPVARNAPSLGSDHPLASDAETAVAHLARRDPYSYRGDGDVPAFDDRGPIAFMDGECALCSTGARLIARLDHRDEFRICPTQSRLGRAVLRHYGLDPDDPESWLYLADGVAYESLDGVIRAGRRLGGVGHLLVVLRPLPPAAQDWLYARLARNRYRLFGRANLCELPSPALRRRLIE